MSQNSDIKINPSVLTERSQTYSSLTDVNGTDVFTSDYEKKVEEYLHAQEERYGSVAGDIFVEQAGKELNEEDAVKNRLFLETSGQIMQAVPERKYGTDTELLLLTGILLVISAVLMLRYFKNRKGKWRSDVNNTYRYE